MAKTTACQADVCCVNIIAHDQKSWSLPEYWTLNVLVVEDDPVIGKALRQGFVEAGSEWAWAKDGPRGLEMASSQQYDVIILDLMLPRLPGLDVLKKLAGTRDPVTGDPIDRAGLGRRSRSRTEFRRRRLFGQTVRFYRADGADRGRLPPHHHPARTGHPSARHHPRPDDAACTRGGIEVDLTPTEFSLLELLMRYAGQVVTRKMLCEHLWQSDWEGTTNVIEVHINRLRGKLDRKFGESMIQTVRGRGYAIPAA